MRCSKSCRLRWTNYLRPGIKRGNFTDHEEKMIIHLQALLGNRYQIYLALDSLKFGFLSECKRLGILYKRKTFWDAFDLILIKMNLWRVQMGCNSVVSSTEDRQWHKELLEYPFEKEAEEDAEWGGWWWR